MAYEFFTKDLSEIEINILLLRIIRNKPDWIYSICVDWRKVEKEEGFKESFRVYNFFEENKAIDFIIDNFNNVPRVDLIPQLLERCHLFIDTDDIISEEIEEINKSIKTIERLYSKLPCNYHSYEDINNNSLYVTYGIDLKEFYIVLQFYALLYITCEKGHLYTYQIYNKKIKDNLNKGIGYRTFCPDCKTTFYLPPNFAELVEHRFRRTFQVNRYQSLKTLKDTPHSFTKQLISKIYLNKKSSEGKFSV